MATRVHIIGEEYGRLLVVSEAPMRGKARVFTCVCSCGNTLDVYMGNLRKGHTQSCGCLQKDAARASNTKHGESTNPLYSTYAHMVDRCTNTESDCYKNYGGRGITVCKRWTESDGRGFLNFIADMGDRPHNHTLERVDNLHGYYPKNCTWADRTSQILNRRKIVGSSKYRGVTKAKGKWLARIRPPSSDGNYLAGVHIGSFGTELEAAVAYDMYIIVNKLATQKNFIGLDTIIAK